MDKHLLTGIVFVTFFVLCPCALGQSTRVQFDVRYGVELEKVAQTGSFDDDIVLAKKMLDDARAEDETTAMVTLICEHVFKQASVFPSSYHLGIEAMQIQGERIPSKQLSTLSLATSLQQKLYNQANESNRQELGESLVDMIMQMADHERDSKRWNAAKMFYEEAINTADEIGSSKRQIILANLSQMEAMQYVANLKQRIERDSNDKEAVEGLMRLYVIELDEPAKALPYQYDTADLDMQKYLELAARDIAELIGGECLELGDWYMTLSERASPGGKPLMHARAKLYYERYMKLHRNNDAKRQRVAKAVESLDALMAPPPGAPGAPGSGPAQGGGGLLAPIEMLKDALGSVGSGGPGGGETVSPPVTGAAGDSGGAVSAKGFEPEEGWIDLMAPIDLIQHVGRGVWDVKDGVLIAEPPTPAQVTTPYMPKGDYIIEARFSRVSVGGSAAIHLPVGDKQVMLLLGERRRRQRDYIAGLDTVEGEPAIGNESATPLELKTAEVYTVRVEIIHVDTDAVISVTLNDAPLLDWTGAIATLGTSTEWTKFAPGALGVGADGGGTFHYFGVRLMMTGGEAVKLP
jgi:hypothetical protein